jgi:hypothetical protein
LLPPSVKLKNVVIDVDNRKIRLTDNSTPKKPVVLVSGLFYKPVAKFTNTVVENVITIEVLKPQAREHWPSLFAAARADSLQATEIRRAIVYRPADSGVELALRVGTLLEVVSLVGGDAALCKGTIVNGDGEIGIFKLSDTVTVDDADLQAELKRWRLHQTELQVQASQAKQKELAALYKKVNVVEVQPTVTGDENDALAFPTAFHESVVKHRQRWHTNLVPDGRTKAWLVKRSEQGAGVMNTSKFGQKLLNSFKSQTIDSLWQRRYCVVDEEQQSLVYGVVHDQGAYNERWEFKGDVFLNGACVSLLKFVLPGRPTCIAVRARMGAKLKTYFFATETMNDAAMWMSALTSAGATSADTMPTTPPCGSAGALLHKLGGGLLPEYQARYVAIEGSGLLNYFEVEEVRVDEAALNRDDYYLKGSLQLPLCNLRSYQADKNNKTKYLLALRQQGSAKDKGIVDDGRGARCCQHWVCADYVFAFDRAADRDQWAVTFQRFGAIDSEKTVNNAAPIALCLRKAVMRATSLRLDECACVYACCSQQHLLTVLRHQ